MGVSYGRYADSSDGGSGGSASDGGSMWQRTPPERLPPELLRRVLGARRPDGALVL
eukprot:SAG11_NODE_6641_length_1274_cov_18.995745_1_plen_55_part_01